MRIKLDLREYFPPITTGAEIYSYGIGLIWYRDSSDVSHDYTIEWCESLKLSNEETLMWYLKFGYKLPVTMKEIQTIMHNQGNVSE